MKWHIHKRLKNYGLTERKFAGICNIFTRISAKENTEKIVAKREQAAKFYLLSQGLRFLSEISSVHLAS